jgi:hypothetical protein
MGSDEARRSAARVQQIGDEVRRLADRALGAGAAQWQSTAAAAFHARLVEQVARVRAVAAELDGAAEALRRHAVALEEAPVRNGLGGFR